MAKKPTETDAIKKMLHEEYDFEGPFTRLRKYKGHAGDDCRIFRDESTGKTYIIVGDADDECYPWPTGNILFSIWTNPHGVEGARGPFDTMYAVSFNPQSYWEENQCLYDQHVEYAVSNILGLPAWFEGEDMENSFSVDPTKTYQDIKDALIALGYVHSPDQEKFVQGI